jgi:hypothetical protein
MRIDPFQYDGGLAGIQREFCGDTLDLEEVNE